MKIFISCDMEGIGGTFSWKDFETYKERYKKIMTEELLATINGIMRCPFRINEIVVSDAHGNGDNIYFEELPKKVSLVRGHPRKLGMMEGIDQKTDLAFFLGYHGQAGTMASVMDHTYASSSIYRIEINGIEVSEAIINGGIAADLGVPVGLISGDLQTVEQAKKFFDKKTEFVVTKESISRFATKTRSSIDIKEELISKAQKALNKINILKPLKWRRPLKTRIELLDTLRADLVAVAPEFKRMRGRQIAFTSKNFIEFHRKLRLLLMLAARAKDYL